MDLSISYGTLQRVRLGLTLAHPFLLSPHHLARFLCSRPDSSLFPTLIHSPMNLMGTGRHSSSSLSSHASSEAGNVVMLGDGSMGEAPEDLYPHMQVPELPKGMGPEHCI